MRKIKRKIEVLNKYDTNELRMLMKLAFDPKLVWKLQKKTHHIKRMKHH